MAQIKDGKWFWIGERYLYRSDKGRRPKGVTEKFKIGIPIGKNRSIEFFANNKSGIVEVSFGGKSQTADLYSQQDKKVKVKIENSDKTALRKTAAVKVLYSVLLFALFATPSFFFCRYYFQNPKKVKNWIFRHRFILIVSGAVLGMLVFMIRNSVYVGMWIDPLYQFGFLKLDFKTALKYVSYQIDGTIYSMFILYPFQRILNFVYGIEYILLPNEICVATSAMLLGFSCKRFGGNKTGYFAVILAALSQAYIISAAYQYRIYAFLLLVSTFILLFYLKRNFQIMKENLYDKKTLIVFGIALFLLVEEHGVTILLPLFLFLFDVYLCYRKKLQVKVLFSYILAGVLYLPKLIYILATNGWPTDDWRPASNILSFLNIFFDYMIRIDIVKVIFIAGVFLAAILFSKSKIKNCNWRIVSLCGAITAIFGAFLTAFVYSGAINPKGSFFVNRYFLFLLPWMFFVCAFVFNAFVMALSKNRRIISSVFCLVFASYFAVTVYPDIYFTMKGDQEWSVSRYNLNRINYLFAQDDIYDKDVGVIISYATGRGEFNGIKAFYISKYGRQDVFQIISAQDLERKTFNKVFLIPLVRPDFHKTLREIEKIKSLGFKETRLDNLGIMVYERR